jgi:hypothetical protein
VQNLLEAVGKRPSAVRQAHGPEQSRRTALPSSPALLNSRCARRRSRFNRASHCGVLARTPHSWGFRKLPSRERDLRQSGISQSSTCIWTFSISLPATLFSTVSLYELHIIAFCFKQPQISLCHPAEMEVKLPVVKKREKYGYHPI